MSVPLSSSSSTVPKPSFLHVEFAAGVTAILRSWSALRTAVESGWGGGQKISEQKANDLRHNILQVFGNGQKPPLYSYSSLASSSSSSSQPAGGQQQPQAQAQQSFLYAISNYDVHDLEDNLAIYLEEEFSVNLEDDSERQVAQSIFQLYERCYKGDSTMTKQLMIQAFEATKLSGQLGLSTKPIVQTVNQEEDEDDDDDSDNDMMVVGDDGGDGGDGNGGGGMADTTPADPTTATAAVAAAVLEMSPEEYASEPVFGKPKRKNFQNKPVRQLGEAIPEEDSAMAMDEELDEDGFAPVKPKGRRR